MLIEQKLLDILKDSNLKSVQDTLKAIDELCDLLDKVYEDMTSELGAEVKGRKFNNLNKYTKQLKYIDESEKALKEYLKGIKKEREFLSDIVFEDEDKQNISIFVRLLNRNVLNENEELMVIDKNDTKQFVFLSKKGTVNVGSRTLTVNQWVNTLIGYMPMKESFKYIYINRDGNSVRLQDILDKEKM